MSGIIYWSLGTLLCSLGLIKRRLRTLDLIRPGVVIPGMIWASVFLPYIVGKNYDDRNWTWREYAEVKAMGFACLCMVFFWIGMWLPFGRQMSRPFYGKRIGFAVEPERYRLHAFLLCCIPLGVSLLWSGPGIFDARLGFTGIAPYVPARVTRAVTVLVDLSTTVGAFAIGFTWPSRNSLTPARLMLHVLGLLCCLQVYMAGFSRGAAVTLVLAFVAMSLRFRKVNLWLAALLAVLVFSMTYTSLQGRHFFRGEGSESGVHYQAGSVRYIEYFFTDGLWAWPDNVTTTVYGLEQLTPMSVTIGGVESHDINQMSKPAWLVHALPLPRWIGVIPEWTTDPTLITGGAYQHPFSYTITIFGDLFAHWGWAGAVFFAILGVVYRFVDELVMNADPVGFGASDRYGVNLQSYYLSFYPLFAGLVYAAMIRGMFNNFRSWVVLTTYSLALLLLAMLVTKFYTPASHVHGR